MSTPFHYHLWHKKAFDRLPTWGSKKLVVPKNGSRGLESKTFYSLKKDMDTLRNEGKKKGIVDAGVVSVGKSSKGRELWALKVGKGAAHKVLFTGCHHAREWISVEIPYLVAKYLIENYNSSPSNEKEKRIKHLLMNRQIWFVPMVNPDGHMHTVTRNRMWRPNRARHKLKKHEFDAPQFGGGSPRTIKVKRRTYTGVDINRNYATAHWGEETFDGGRVTTSRDPADSGTNSLWCGVGPGSEKETKAIDALFKAHKFRASITYHNFSQLLLYPDAAAGDTFLQEVGKGMNALIAEHGNPYTYQSGSALYPTTGDLMDFSYETVPNRPTYTPELRPKKSAPKSMWFSGLPESQIEPCFKENLAAALALINCAGHDKMPAKKKCKFKMAGIPPFVFPIDIKCQVVKNCWEVFKGWTP